MHNIRINCVSSRVTRNRINYYQMRWSFACVDNTIIRRPPNGCITSWFKAGKKAILCCAKRKYKTATATTTETKPNRWNLSGGRIYLKSWSTTLVTWWVREMNKRNSNTNPACQRWWWWREEKKKHPTEHTWCTCSTHSRCDFTWNDYKWSRMKWLRKWIYRTVQWVHLARDKIFVRWLNA